MFDRGENIFEAIEHPILGNVENISVKKISSSRYQPRIRFNEQDLLKLSDEIKENGLMQPITVKENGDRYEIVAGERRFRAGCLAGYTELPCYVLAKEDMESIESALTETIQNGNLTAVEEGKAYVLLMRQAGMTQEQASAKVGKSQSAVANKIRLLNLPEEIQNAVIDKQISERHARALLQVPEDQQINVLHYIVDRGLNVRQSEAYIDELGSSQKKHKKQKTKGFTRNIQIGINSINQCVKMIQKMGIDVMMDTEESLTDVRIVIRFPR